VLLVQALKMLVLVSPKTVGVCTFIILAFVSVLVQPVAIDYGAAFGFAAWVGDEEYGPNAKRILSRPGTIPVVLRFLEPIDPHVAGDRKVLAARCQTEVEDALSASAPPAVPL